MKSTEVFVSALFDSFPAVSGSVTRAKKTSANQQTITVILEPLALVRFVNSRNCVCSAAFYAMLKSNRINQARE